MSWSTNNAIGCATFEVLLAVLMNMLVSWNENRLDTDASHLTLIFILYPLHNKLAVRRWFYNIQLTFYLPSLKPVLQEVEERLLHHVRDLIAFERRTNKDDWSHRGNHVVGCCGFLLLEERFPLFFGRWRRERCLAEPGIPNRVRVFTCSMTPKADKRTKWSLC